MFLCSYICIPLIACYDTFYMSPAVDTCVDKQINDIPVTRMKGDSSSLSFLNYDWCDTTTVSNLVYPLILDPLYTGYYVEIGSKFKNMIQDVNFTYKLCDEECIRVRNINDNSLVLHMHVVEYSKSEILRNCNTKVCMVLNKNKFRRKVSAEINKRYRKKIQNNYKNIDAEDMPESIENEYRRIRIYLYELQVQENMNIFYVEDCNDFVKEIKNVLRFVASKKAYIPKVKTFKKDDKTKYTEYTLSKIPGLGKCASNTLAEKHNSLYELYKELLAQNNDIENLIVEDTYNTKFRRLGKQQLSKIKKALLSSDGEERLQ